MNEKIQREEAYIYIGPSFAHLVLRPAVATKACAGFRLIVLHHRINHLPVQYLVLVQKLQLQSALCKKTVCF